MGSSIALELSRTLDADLVPLFTSGSAALASALAGPFKSLAIFSLTLTGVLMAWGVVPLNIGEATRRLLRIVIIAALALNAGLYGDKIATTAYAMPDEFVAVISQDARISSVNTAIDTALDKSDQASFLFKQQAAGFFSVDSWWWFILSFISGIAGGLVCGFAILEVYSAKILLAVLIAVGPLFIVMLLFQATHRYFGLWAGWMMQCMLAFLLVACVIAITFGLWDRALQYAIDNAANGLQAFLYCIVVGVLTVGSMFKVGKMAVGLAGGVDMAASHAVTWASARMRLGRR